MTPQDDRRQLLTEPVLKADLVRLARDLKRSIVLTMLGLTVACLVITYLAGF